MRPGPPVEPDDLRLSDRRSPDWRIVVGVVVLGALAYLPGLLTAHGILPADTKLYLSVDPGRLMGSAASLWDNSQFGGWVTHQTVGYLWPTGPWYWAIEHLGGPAWVAQRLFVGTVFLSAGTGVWWCGRRLGLAHRGAWAAGIVYQLSPYVLPYASRTSVLLSPWAGLGWLVGLTVLAARRGGWLYPAAFALVVATVGGINATAIALIAVAPVLWLIQATWGAREITARRAVSVALRLGALSLVVSLWWLVPLSLESRYGADVLAYSETVSAVSSTSLGSEVLRGLGYWLFYGGDVTGRWTSASTPYLQAPGLIGLGFALAAIGIAGILLIRWRYRSYLAALVVAGLVLSVGAYGMSPLANLLQGSERSTLVLALRSSTRAVPVLLLGLAIGVGALLTAWRPRLPGATLAATAAVGVLAVANLPSIWNGNIVDTTLRHPEEMPAWWHQAADAASAAAPGTRLLELPGAEFAAHRWGQTNDPVMPGLTDRPTIARDLLPLGSPGVMDLLYALDDRFQSGIAERAAIAPVARLLGAGDILFRGDVAFDKYQNPRPGETWALYDTGAGTDGLGRPVPFGPLQPNEASVPMTDETSLSSAPAHQPVPQLALVPVEGAAPMVRASAGQRAVVLAGSGAGVVDAAAAGLIDGTELLRYSADTDAAAAIDTGTGAGAATVPGGALLVVTDSNRKQAHQWRGSQDVSGFTEDEGPGLLDEDDADHRLPVFGDDGGGPDEQTLAEQRGPIHATASAYGTPDSYRPEDRAYHAIDGDPTTAWSVGDGGTVVGQRIRLDLDAPRDLRSVRLVQLLQPVNRRITEVRLTTEAGSRTTALDPSSSSPNGQTVALPPGRSSWLEIEITGATGGRLVDYSGLDPVGFSTVDLDGLRADEVVRTPIALLAGAGPASLDHPLAFVFTRDRVDARKRWRDDPEPALVRDFALPTARSFRLTGTAHLAPRGGDPVLDRVAPPAGSVRADANSRLAGVPTAGGRAAVDGDPATAWQTAFGPARGATLTVTEPAPLTIDHLDLRILADGQHSVPTSLVLSNGAQRRTVVLPALPDRGGTASTPVRVRFAPMTGSRFMATIAGTRDVTTLDRESARTVTLPVGIAELGLPSPGSARPPAAGALPVAGSGTCRSDLVTVDGRPVPVRIDGTRAAALAGQPLIVAACSSLRLSGGDHILRAAPGVRTGLDLDRLVLTSAAGGAAAAPGPLLAPPLAGGPTATVLSSDRTHRHVEVTGGDGPFWLVSGEGLNEGWHATVDGTDLGPPQPADGGMNAWRVPRTGGQRVDISLTWTPQRAVWLAYLLSAAGVVLCLALLVLGRRRLSRVDPSPADGPVVRSLRAPNPAASGDGRLPWPPLLVATGLVAALTLIVFAPLAALVVAAAMLVAGRIRWARLLCAVVSLGAVAATGLFYVVRQWRSRPEEGFGWPSRFHLGHPMALTAIVFLAADVALTAIEHRARRAGSEPSTPDPDEAAPSAPIRAGSGRG
jgi:hypothetical protein